MRFGMSSLMPSALRRSRWAGIGSTLLGLLVGVVPGMAFADQPRPWEMFFQDPATPVMDRVESFHHLLLWVIAIIVVFVAVLLVLVMIRFRESVNPTPSRRSHHTMLEVVWTAVPVLILVVVAVPSFKLLYYSDVVPAPDLTIKATGHQWYWEYEYPDNGDFSFVSNIVDDADLQPGQLRLLTTDNVVVVPVGKNVRLQVTAGDVIHSWAVPSFGVKIDAVPGRLNEAWFNVKEPGTYYGQCSELCGTMHGFMPIMVKAVPQDEYDAWVKQAQSEFAADSRPEATKVADAGRLPALSLAAR